MVIALLALAAMLVIVLGTVDGVAYAAGFGPLLGWAWSSFSAAELWWQKTLIAVGTLTGFAAFARLIWWLARKLADQSRRW